MKHYMYVPDEAADPIIEPGTVVVYLPGGPGSVGWVRPVDPPGQPVQVPKIDLRRVVARRGTLAGTPTGQPTT